MRALKISRDPDVSSQGKTILIVTHSWAMAERIDGVLSTLNGGVEPNNITIFPLLSLLEFHAGHVGQGKTEIIGDDSTEGRVKSIKLIREVLSNIAADDFPDLSEWICRALSAGSDSHLYVDLSINLYDEISGVLSASGVAPDDQDAKRRYISDEHEDWMPPFEKPEGRRFVFYVYQAFIKSLIDRSSITTNQFVLDSIRILETFSWRMRKATDGYDYIFIDELQLFDPQERTAIELLGRSGTGVPFVMAEDPSQVVFSALNARRQKEQIAPVYLKNAHRFDRGIFNFINFIYQKFPLNAVALLVDFKGSDDGKNPDLYTYPDNKAALEATVSLAKFLQTNAGSQETVCVATLSDIDGELEEAFSEAKVSVVRLYSFDDVEKVGYQKRSIVLAPWQFIGGTQFHHVIVAAAGVKPANSQFGRLREMTSVYLACSRAAASLSVIFSDCIPNVIAEAEKLSFIEQKA